LLEMDVDRIFSTSSAYLAFFIGNIRLKVRNCSTKHELRPSANSSFGLCSMTDVICKLASHLVVS
jgi:hypothetical protein